MIVWNRDYSWKLGNIPGDTDLMKDMTILQQQSRAKDLPSTEFATWTSTLKCDIWLFIDI